MGGLRVVVVAACLLAGCIDAEFVQCEDGRICPAGEMCDARHATCVTSDQISRCAGVPFGTPCEVSGMIGACLDGVCLPEGCGNRVIEPARGELCDDGNQVSGDGCRDDCLSDERCGNAIPDVGELCDDGNLMSHDGCDSRCVSETVSWTTVPLAPNGLYADNTVYRPTTNQLHTVFRSELWTLTGDRWRRDPLPPFEVGATFDEATYFYDADADRLAAVRSSYVTGNTYQLALYTWDGSAWLAEPGAGLLTDGHASLAAYDATRHRTIVLVGSGGSTLSWAVSPGGQWVALSPISPYLGQATIGVDPATDELVVASWNGASRGYALADNTWTATALPTTADTLFMLAPHAGELYALALDDGGVYVRHGGTWVAVAAMRFPYAYNEPRYSFAQLYSDASTGELVFAGPHHIGRYRGGAWQIEELPGSSSRVIATPAGLAILSRPSFDGDPDAHLFALDGDGYRALGTAGALPVTSMLACGYSPGRRAAICTAPDHETYALDATGWHVIVDIAGASTTYGPIGYDPVHRRLVMAGNHAWATLADDATAWTTQIITTPFDDWHSVVWDARDQKMIATWAELGNYPNPTVGGLYELADDAWAREPLAPSVRLDAVANERRGTVLMFEADDGTIWERTGDQWDIDDRVDSMRGVFTPTYDAATGTIAGLTGTVIGVELAIRRYASATPFETCVEGADVDGDGLAGCADPDCYASCTACPPFTTCP